MAAELTKSFLVAAPALRDPNFSRSVVLLVEHKPAGSLGFIINRPSRLSFREVATRLRLRVKEPLPDLPVLEGGPVAPQTGWLVFDPADRPVRDGELTVTDRLRVSTSTDLLAAIAQSRVITRHVLVLGYAGWGAGQLETEIQAGSWIPVDVDESILFETAADDRWGATLRSLGIDPMRLVSPSIMA